MEIMKRIWRFAAPVAVLAAGMVNAADFVEKPETAFSDEWKVVQKVGTTGLECSTRDGVLTVTGLAGADTAKNGVSVWTLERKFAPVSGDFAAAVQFDWDVQDKAFMGEFLLEVVDEQGKVLAAAGFSDGWIAQQGVMRGCVGEPGKKIESVPGVRIPLRGRGVFGIDRVGGAYRFLWNGKSMKAQTGSDVPAAGVRLVFRFSRYAGNDKLPPSHFGDFAIREVSFRAKEAAKASFSEKPADGFSPAWRQGVTGARGLTCKADDGVLLVNGFAEEDNAKIAATEVTLERSVAPCPGDFTAALDMEYDTLDKAFMGAVLILVLDQEGKLIAEGGLIDHWEAYPGRAAAGIGKEKTPATKQQLPLKASGVFKVERRGKVITVRLRDWKFLETEGSVAPVGAVRLVFRRNRRKNCHFGNFKIREVSFAPGAEEVKGAVAPSEVRQWRLQEPIIWYWAGPDMSDEFAAELKAGGWNTAFGRNVFDLDIMQKHGLKGVLWMPGNPDSPENIARLKFWLDSVRNHPALLGVSCGDEPGGERMLKAQKRVEFMIENAPELLHFNNMYPYGASNKQLGHEGAPTQAYTAHIQEYFERLKPQLLSYDHYTFFKRGDRGTYFYNQALIRKAALEHNIPSMNIVQGCAWTIQTRVPTPDEYRYLAYTSLAYGSQGLSCYVYSYRKHWGSMRDPVTGETGELYEAAKSINREFYAIAKELRPYRSLHAYHTGEIPFGAETLEDSCVFQVEPKLKNVSQGLVEPQEFKIDGQLDGQDNTVFKLRPPITGWILGVFGKDGKASHVLVVNLDYKKNARTTLVGPAALERFDALKGVWSKVGGNRAELDVPPGSGVLLRIAQ